MYDESEYYDQKRNSNSIVCDIRIMVKAGLYPAGWYIIKFNSEDKTVGPYYTEEKAELGLKKKLFSLYNKQMKSEGKEEFFNIHKDCFLKYIGTWEEKDEN